MESLYLLIPIGIVFVIIAVKILFWAINSGQYDNLDTEAHRILFDEQVVPNDERTSSKPADAISCTESETTSGGTAPQESKVSRW